MTKRNPYLTMNKSIIRKSSFIKLVAQESGFTINDTKIFWKAVERVIAKSLLADKVLHIGRFGVLYIKDIPASTEERPAWNVFRGKYFQRKASKRIVFHISTTYKKLAEGYQTEEEFNQELDNDNEEGEYGEILE